MKVFTNIDEKILRQLAHYKFLTLSHLVKLGTGEKTYVSSRLKLLRDDGFVGVSKYGGVYVKGQGGGRVENINYLLPKGAKFLAENISELPLEKIHYPKNIDGIFRNDYYHRISTINIQVSFELWAKEQGYQPLFFHTYFHKVGAAKKTKENDPLKSITRVVFRNSSFIEPDIIFAYDNSGERKIFVCEVCNGKDTTRHVEALKRLGDAIAEGLITNMYKEEYSIEVSPRILCTVETEDMLRLVLKRIKSDSYFTKGWMEQAFFFQVADKIWKNFNSCWINIKNMPERI